MIQIDALAVPPVSFDEASTSFSVHRRRRPQDGLHPTPAAETSRGKADR